MTLTLPYGENSYESKLVMRFTVQEVRIPNSKGSIKKDYLTKVSSVSYIVMPGIFPGIFVLLYSWQAMLSYKAMPRVNQFTGWQGLPKITPGILCGMCILNLQYVFWTLVSK